jgi:transcriptional regulator with XRE-family HTH domain
MPPRKKAPETQASDFAWRLGSALRRRREELGFSQEYVAERAGVSTKYLGRIERAEVNAGIDNIERVVSALTPRRPSRISKTWTSRMIARIDDIQAALTNIKKWLESTGDDAW